MRKLLAAAAVAVVALSLAACGGSSKSSTSKTATTPHPHYKKVIQGPAKVPAVPAANAACKPLAPLGSGTAGAAKFEHGLDAAITGLQAFAAEHAPTEAVQVGQLRVKSLLPTMIAARAAAARYLASASAKNRQSLAAAVTAEKAATSAEVLYACAIPGS